MIVAHYFILGVILAISFLIGWLPDTKKVRVILVSLTFIFAYIVSATTPRFTSEVIHLLLSFTIFALPSFLGSLVKHYSAKN